jgi:hypothetical protein
MKMREKRAVSLILSMLASVGSGRKNKGQALTRLPSLESPRV